MPCELGLAEKHVISRVMAEIRLKTVITRGNTRRRSGAPVREEFFMFEGNRQGLGLGDELWSAQGRVHLSCTSDVSGKQLTLLSGITSPPDSLVFYHSHPCTSVST